MSSGIKFSFNRTAPPGYRPFQGYNQDEEKKKKAAWKPQPTTPAATGITGSVASGATPVQKPQQPQQPTNPVPAGAAGTGITGSVASGAGASAGTKPNFKTHIYEPAMFPWQEDKWVPKTVNKPDPNTPKPAAPQPQPPVSSGPNLSLGRDETQPAPAQPAPAQQPKPQPNGRGYYSSANDNRSTRNKNAAAQGMSPVFGPNGFEGYKPMAQVQTETNQMGTHVPGKSGLMDAHVTSSMRANGGRPLDADGMYQARLKTMQDQADGRVDPGRVEEINAEGYTGHVGQNGLHGSPGMRDRAQNPFDDLDGAPPWVRKKLTETPSIRPGDTLGGQKMKGYGADDRSTPRLNPKYGADPFSEKDFQQPTARPDSYTDEFGTWNSQTGEGMKPQSLPGTPIPAAPAPNPGVPAPTPAPAPQSLPGTPTAAAPAPDTGFDSKSTAPSNNIPQPAAPAPAPAPAPNPGVQATPAEAADPYGGGSGFLQDPSRNKSPDHVGGGSGFLQNPDRNAPIDDETRARVAASQQEYRDGIYDEGVDRLAEYEAEDEQAYQDDMARLDGYEATETGGTGDAYENAMAEYGGPEQFEHDYYSDNLPGYEEANKGFDDLKDHYAEEQRKTDESLYRGIPPEPEAVDAATNNYSPAPQPGGDPANLVPGGPGSAPDEYPVDEFDEEEERRRMIEEEERKRQQQGQHWS